MNLVCLPYTTCRFVYWACRWVLLFALMRRQYGLEEKIYLTRRRFGLSQSQWDGLGTNQQDNFLSRHLWITENWQV
ncbi:unnamed protein product [Protopolystoma xenopodis]|uniref:Uncharacterized protein n=1 Tax=Protopolystoma xenopodis TaxID=117903 RepID=A0A3S5BPI0_9PLAT|nr:unnamed protein product [Protopolystoma xenopodis]